MRRGSEGRERNAVARMTAGLGALQAMVASPARAAAPSQAGDADEMGPDRLAVRAGMPLLAQRYRYTGQLGEGTFAQLVAAIDEYRTRPGAPAVAVAIKVMHRPYGPIGEREASLLRQVNASDPDALVPVVRLLDVFLYQGHVCLVFERLLADPLAIPRPIAGDQSGMLRYVRKIAFQLFVATAYLHRLELIHADLKPENVLFTRPPAHLAMARDSPGARDRLEHGARVKLVDFGNSMHWTDATVYYDDYEVQSLLYRAPEVLLGLPFGPAIDMWSVGCILAELWAGRPLFSGATRAQLVVAVAGVRGPFPSEVFQHAKFWQPEHATPANHAQWAVGGRPRLVALARQINCQHPPFLDLLDRLLELDPHQRLTPHQALCHPFVQPLVPVALLFPDVSGAVVTPVRPAAVPTVPAAVTATAVVGGPSRPSPIRTPKPTAPDPPTPPVGPATQPAAFTVLAAVHTPSVAVAKPAAKSRPHPSEDVSRPRRPRPPAPARAEDAPDLTVRPRPPPAVIPARAQPQPRPRPSPPAPSREAGSVRMTVDAPATQAAWRVPDAPAVIRPQPVLGLLPASVRAQLDTFSLLIVDDADDYDDDRDWPPAPTGSHRAVVPPDAATVVDLADQAPTPAVDVPPSPPSAPTPSVDVPPVLPSSPTPSAGAGADAALEKVLGPSPPPTAAAPQVPVPGPAPPVPTMTARAAVPAPPVHPVAPVDPYDDDILLL